LLGVWPRSLLRGARGRSQLQFELGDLHHPARIGSDNVQWVHDDLGRTCLADAT
jgi:hypothetical protein